MAAERMTQQEARAWYVNVLMDKIRSDRHPSTTHMFMVEQALESMPELVPDYMEILLDKVGSERYPSTTMLQRITRVAEWLPASRPRELPAGSAGS
jgi:hypothetical protein